MYKHANLIAYIVIIGITLYVTNGGRLFTEFVNLGAMESTKEAVQRLRDSHAEGTESESPVEREDAKKHAKKHARKTPKPQRVRPASIRSFRRHNPWCCCEDCKLAAVSDLGGATSKRTNG